MSAWSRFTRGETTIDFVGRRRTFLVISLTLIAISLGALALRGLNLGLEFTGGISVRADNVTGAGIEDYRSAIRDAGLPDPDRIQFVDDGAGVRIQSVALPQDEQALLVETIVEVSGSDPGEVSLSAIGPSFGALVARRAIEALAVFLGAAALFITWRLQWKMAIAGLVALIHDLLLTVGVYALTGFAVTPATVVAILTILGYSLYDTVVVFDRVEEIEGLDEGRSTYPEIVNRAMNQVFARSMLTSLTSLLPIGSLLFVGSLILGATTLQDFALALFVGVAVGTYSSVGVAAPLLAVWKSREPEWQERREARDRPSPRRSARAKEKAAPATAPPDDSIEPRAPKRRRR